MNIEVSFITTVKNGAEFITQTINSVINQSIENWEYIIVDDGSTDNTLQVIKDIAINEPRIKTVLTKGVGRGKALNLAIEKTKGQFIVNLDADDPCHPQRAEIQVDFLEQNKEFSLVATNSIFLEENESPVWKYLDCEGGMIETKDITITNNKPFRQESINHSSIMFRKKDLVEIGKYDENRKYQFDYELWIRFSLSNFKIGLVPLRLSSKRIHSKQAFELRNRKEYLKSSLALKKYIIRKLDLPLRYNVYVNMRYYYGFLPISFRKRLRKLLS